MCGDQYCLVKRTGDVLTVVPSWCKCWTCTDCRPARVARLVYEAKLGRPTIFITLTWRVRPGVSKDRAAVLLSAAWRQVRREYLDRHGARSLDFLAVFEETKLGWPHLHIVARCKWIDQRWLSKRMAALIGSPIVWVNRISSLRKVAAYVSKYIGKNPHRFAGVKRYWRSVRYLDPALLDDDDPDEGTPGWQKIEANWINMARAFERVGFCALYLRRSVVLRYGVPP